MRKDLVNRLILVAAVMAICVYGIIPPSKKIRLGLDLKGGIHLVLRVETDDAVKAVLDNRVSAVRTAMGRQNLGGTVSADLEHAAVVIDNPDTVESDKIRSILETETAGYSISSQPGRMSATLPPLEVDRIKDDAIEDTIERIRNRVSAFGVEEAPVQRQGLKGSRILIQLPGVDDPARVKDLVAKPAFLEFKKVELPPGMESYGGGGSREEVVQLFGGNLPPSIEVFEGQASGGSQARWWPLSLVSPISGSDLINARTGRGELGSAEVAFSLTPDAGQRFESFTSQNVNRQLAALLDKRVIQVARIESTIRDNGRITGLGTLQEADDLTLKLKSGALPARTTVLEERTVGPSLGADSIRQGVWASIAGLVASILFMMLYYKASGINAVVALILNVVMLLGIMSYFGATLTLPGIAGVILTFGMALDANVLIFERIREELRLGKTVRSSIEAGFKKAFWTIFDSNFTTVIAAALLFQFGTGPVRGFALTLVIGLAASMFTAIYVSRLLFDATMKEGKRVDKLSI